MGFWLVAIWLISLIGSRLLRPREKGPKRTVPELPRVDIGAPIPVIWGTVLLDAPLVAWYGDLSIVRANSDEGKYHRYYVGTQYVWCWGPLDALIEVRWDRRNIFPSPEHGSGFDYEDHDFNSPALFGGTGAAEEGGVVGTWRFFYGTETQTADPYLAAQIGETLPDYPGLVHSVGHQMYVGNTAYLKPVSIVGRRCPNQLGVPSGYENIDGDANPACCIYELLTDTRWGRRIDPADIDAAAFEAAAQTLALEGLGLSMKLEGSQDASALIEDVCRHIDGRCFQDPTSGLFTIVLIRGGYDPLDLPLLDHDDLLAVEFERPSWESLANSVRLGYNDRTDSFIDKTASAQDLASIQARAGEVTEQEIRFPGATTPAVAQLLAARTLKSLSYPGAQLTITTTRKAWALRPASAFRLNWPPLGIVGMVCRVERIGTGTLNAGEIRIEAFEDFFGVDWTAYAAPPDSGWVDPHADPPGPPEATDLHGLPYELAKDTYEPALLPSGLALFAPDAATQSTGFVIHYLRDDLTWGEKQIDSLTPYGTLNAAVDEWTAIIDIAAVVGLEGVADASDEEFQTGRNLVLICPATRTEGSDEAIGRTSEIVAFQNISDLGGGVFQLTTTARGCLDTVPRAFPSGSRVYFLSYGYGRIATSRPDSVTTTRSLVAKFEPIGIGEYPDWTTEEQHTLDFEYAPPGPYSNREDLPLSPTRLRINDFLYPDNIDGGFYMDWRHRDRLGSWAYGNSGETSAPESGVVYVVRIYGEGGTLVYENTAVTGTSFSWSLSAEVAASGLGRANGQLRVVLFAIRPSGTVSDVLNAWQPHDFTFDCAGWGMLWGNYWGGSTGRS